MYYLAQLIDYLFNIVIFLLIARVLLSWIPHDPYHPVVEFLHQITDPILEPCRRILPPSSMGVDFSPIIAFVILSILQSIIHGVIG